MACEYSPSVADAIDARWAQYDYDRADVVDMIVRISRSSSVPRSQEIAANEKVSAEALLAAGCE